MSLVYRCHCHVFQQDVGRQVVARNDKPDGQWMGKLLVLLSHINPLARLVLAVVSPHGAEPEAILLDDILVREGHLDSPLATYAHEELVAGNGVWLWQCDGHPGTSHVCGILLDQIVCTRFGNEYIVVVGSHKQLYATDGLALVCLQHVGWHMDGVFAIIAAHAVVDSAV